MTIREQILDLSPQHVLCWQLMAVEAGHEPTYGLDAPQNFTRFGVFDHVEVGQFKDDPRIWALWMDGELYWRQELPLQVAWDWHLIEDPREH